jgi:multisubunit Na+/H+ antiporter MnhE subunit
MPMPSLTATIASLVVALAVAAFANWQMRRPFDKRFLPVVPWLAVQFLAAVIVLIMAAHLISLLTGKSFGRHY